MRSNAQHGCGSAHGIERPVLVPKFCALAFSAVYPQGPRLQVPSHGWCLGCSLVVSKYKPMLRVVGCCMLCCMSLSSEVYMGCRKCHVNLHGTLRRQLQQHGSFMPGFVLPMCMPLHAPRHIANVCSALVPHHACKKRDAAWHKRLHVHVHEARLKPCSMCAQ